MTLFDWYSQIVEETYTLRGFKKNEDQEATLMRIYSTIEADRDFNRTKAEMWLKYGEFPYVRKSLILQDFYPTVNQIESVKSAQNVLVMTKEEHRQKCLAFRSPFELELATECEQLREQLSRIDHNKQLHEAFRQIINLNLKNGEQLDTMDKMAKKIQTLEDTIERMKTKIPKTHMEYVDEHGIDHSVTYAPALENLIANTTERMHV